MGNNYRFKLSYMMPNAWFYKLKDIGRSRKQTSTTTTSQSRKKKHSSSTPTSSTKHSSKPKQQHQYNIPRKSYHFARDLNLNLNYSHDTSDDILNTSPKTEKDLTTTNFHEPLRKSIKQRAKRRTSKTSLTKISYSSSLSPLELELYNPEFRTDNVLLATESLSFHDRVSLSNNNSSCGCKVLLSNNNTNNDIIIDVDNNSIARKDDKLGGDCDDPFSELVLPPIVTKPSTTKFNDLLSDDAKNNNNNNNNKETKPRSRMVTHKDQEHNVKGETRFTESKSLKGSLLKVKIVKEDIALMKEMRNNSSGSRRLRLRINSPRIRSRKSVSSTAAAGSRRSLSNSFAIVKSSFNPERDFRESMMEMIVHNNIRGSKDLEDLLACYLSLNSDEYHHLIIKVFKQIWFDLIDNH